jgi:cytochrome c-type biogenesis protein CcmH/NrfG
MAVAGWPAYAAALQRAGPNPDGMVTLGVAAVAMMEGCSKARADALAKGTATPEGGLGSCLAGEGEG